MTGSAPRDYAPLARRLLTTFLMLATLAAAGWWAWQQPFMASTRMLWEISRMPSPTALPVPVAGVAPERIADTFGSPRGGDRQHAGVDIFAERGTSVHSSRGFAERRRGAAGRSPRRGRQHR